MKCYIQSLIIILSLFLVFSFLPLFISSDNFFPTLSSLLLSISFLYFFFQFYYVSILFFTVIFSFAFFVSFSPGHSLDSTISCFLLFLHEFFSVDSNACYWPLLILLSHSAVVISMCMFPFTVYTPFSSNLLIYFLVVFCCGLFLLSFSNLRSLLGVFASKSAYYYGLFFIFLDNFWHSFVIFFSVLSHLLMLYVLMLTICSLSESMLVCITLLFLIFTIFILFGFKQFFGEMAFSCPSFPFFYILLSSCSSLVLYSFFLSCFQF